MGPIAPIISVVSGLFGIYSGVQSYKESREAAEAQEELAEMDAANIRAESGEEKRRAAVVEATRRGKSIAEMGASGLLPSGSLQRYEEHQRDLFSKEMAWVDRSAASRAQQSLLKGKTAAAGTKAGGQEALLSGITKGAGSIYKGGQTAGWWA